MRPIPTNELMPLNLQALYDTVQIPVGVDLKEKKFYFFADMSGKGYEETNMPQAKWLPGGWKMAIERIWMVIVRKFAGDIWRFPREALLEISLGSWEYSAPLGHWHYATVLEERVALKVESKLFERKPLKPPVKPPALLTSSDRIEACLSMKNSYQLAVPIKCRAWISGEINTPIEG